MKSLYIILIILSITVPLIAQEWHWERNDELLNPYHIYTKGMNTPFTGDFDGDGDIDLIVGCRGGVLQYYENIGTADSAIWQMDDDYFETIELDTNYAPQPSLVDLDGDGVDELYLTFGDNLYGFLSGNFDAYRNDGSQQDPVWQEVNLAIEIPPNSFGAHQFVDFDFDGDYDLLISGDRWMGDDKFYYENIGTPQSYDFQLNNAIFEHLDFGYAEEFTLYHFADVSGDEKYELILFVGLFDVDGAEMHYFSYTGTSENPVWEELPIWYGSVVVPMATFADLDNDSDNDMLVGNHYVPLFYNENIGTPDSLIFATNVNGQWLGPLNIDGGNHITFSDYDNDHDFDLIYWGFWRSIWDNYGYLSSATNRGTAQFPVLDNLSGFVSGTFFGYAGYHTSSGDLNGDGFPELATSWPYLNYYPNIDGTGYNIDNHLPTGIEDIGFRDMPELADLNSDGLTDVIYRDDSLEWLAYQNVGTPESPEFVANQEWLEGIDMPIRKFRAANIARDDKTDLIGVNVDGAYAGFLNTGDAGQVDFTYIPAIFDNYADIVSQDFDCVDIDGDGDDDILAIYEDLITTIENQTRVDISDDGLNLPNNLALMQNYPNPFNGSTTISFELEMRGEVELMIYDILGRRVEMLAMGSLAAGIYKIDWSPEDRLPSGIYFCRLTCGKDSISEKMVMIK